MAGSIYAHVRVDEAVITDSDRGFIKNREIEVREETPSHENVAAVIVAAVHILFDRYSVNSNAKFPHKNNLKRGNREKDL